MIFTKKFNTKVMFLEKLKDNSQRTKHLLEIIKMATQ